MRRLFLISLVLAAPALSAQAVIDPGMTRAAVVARLGAPAMERTSGEAAYLFYTNNCERTCGINDVVFLDRGVVTDAVFRSAKRRYSGASSSPHAVPAEDARNAKATRPVAGPAGNAGNAGDAGDAPVVVSLSVTAVTRPATSLYDRIGGLPAVKAAVHEMVTNAMADVRIKAFFAGIDMERVDRNLVAFVCKAAGGPCVYEGKTMPKAHEGLKLQPAHFDALVEDLTLGLDKLKVPAAEQRELLSALAATRKDILGK